MSADEQLRHSVKMICEEKIANRCIMYWYLTRNKTQTAKA